MKKNILMVVGVIAAVFMIIVIQTFKSDAIFEDATSSIGSTKSVSSKDEKIAAPVIENFEVKSDGTRNQWLKLELRIKNPNNVNIDYIKIGFDILDGNGNLIDSSWTNDTNIEGNSVRIITKNIDNREEYKSVRPKVLEYNVY